MSTKEPADMPETPQPEVAPSTVDIAWIDDNNSAGPQKLSNSIRCF